MSVENCSGGKQVGKEQVIDELNNAEEIANRLVTKVDILETRLHTVLRDIVPLPSLDSKEQAEAVLVPLANQVRSHYLLLRNLGNRLEEMSERLEMSKTLNPSEAVYGFAAWLTTRKEKTVMSATDDSAPIAELVAQFCEANNLPNVSENWPLYLILDVSGEVAVPGVGKNA